jgi:hypothetical protein
MCKQWIDGVVRTHYKFSFNKKKILCRFSTAISSILHVSSITALQNDDNSFLPRALDNWQNLKFLISIDYRSTINKQGANNKQFLQQCNRFADLPTISYHKRRNLGTCCNELADMRNMFIPKNHSGANSVFIFQLEKNLASCLVKNISANKSFLTCST